MKRYMLVFPCLLFVLQIFVGAQSLDKEGLKIELIKVLERFSDDQQISMDEVLVLFCDLAVNQPAMSKGGFGLLDGDVYVDLECENNRLLVGKNEDWVGLPREVSELVLMTKEGKVIVGEKLSDPSDLIAVMFSPDRVKIVDLETGIGCVYQRQEE